MNTANSITGKQTFGFLKCTNDECFLLAYCHLDNDVEGKQAQSNVDLLHLDTWHPPQSLKNHENLRKRFVLQKFFSN